MNKVKICAAIASKTGVTLYLTNGEEMSLSKESWRTRAILDEVLPVITRHKIATIDLDAYSIEAKIEQKTGGFIRFLRRSAAKLGNLLGLDHPTDVGAYQGDKFVVPSGKDDEVVVAVVGGKEIANVQKLQRHMENAIYNDKVAGFQRFMERLASVIDERQHSIQELLNFMQRADLPIADDGSIVAYKVLTTGYGNKEGIFVDCHTHLVKQKVGSHVSMDESLIDLNRRTQCSTGLHVARRGYLRNFDGDVITLIKIAPEDVICVPYNEPDKMRVAGYHIVASLPKEVHPILRSNQPMTGNETAAKILADVIAGNHVGIEEWVRIGGPNGTNLTVTPALGKHKDITPLQNGVAKALDDGVSKPVTVKEIKQKVAVEKTEIEDARERRNRVKREKRAAAKAAGQNVVKSKPKKVVATTPSAAPARKLTDAQKKAVKLAQKGKLSMRAIERETGVPARTLGRILRSL